MRVVLVDRQNHHLFQPLLYQVASATLSFAVGDLAAFTHGPGGPLPGVAPVAIQQGEWAAANLLATLTDQPQLRLIVGRGAPTAPPGSPPR